jgi:hypothetical protein
VYHSPSGCWHAIYYFDVLCKRLPASATAGYVQDTDTRQPSHHEQPSSTKDFTKRSKQADTGWSLQTSSSTYQNVLQHIQELTGHVHTHTSEQKYVYAK